jgi:hypothetical protein
MSKRILLALFIFTLSVLWTPVVVEAVPIAVAPFVTVSVGDTFAIPISISDAVDLEFFQFDLAFAPLIVQADTAGATAGVLLPGDWFLTSPGAVDNTNGDILGVSASGSAFSGSGVIANFEFTALAPGISPLTFSNVFLNLSEAGFDIANGQITVTGPPPGGGGGDGGAAQVPEPATLPLLTSGLALLGAGRLARVMWSQ